MNSCSNDFEQATMDKALREALSEIDRPTLAIDFENRLERRLRETQEGHPISAASGRWTMRLYWLFAGLAALGILRAVGSPEPSVTWITVVGVVVAVGVSGAPQLLFRRRARWGLLDLIVASVS